MAPDSAVSVNVVCSMDFMFDALTRGARCQVLIAVNVSSVSLSVRVSSSLHGQRVMRFLDQVA